MKWLLDALTKLFHFFGLPEKGVEIATDFSMAILFVLVLFVAQRFLSAILTAGTHFWAKRTKNVYDDAFCDALFPSRLAHLLAAIAGVRFYDELFPHSENFLEFFKVGTNTYFAIAVAGTIYSVIDAAMKIGMGKERLKDLPIKGFFQALKILLGLCVGIWILSILSDKSPAYFLSGLGALMAVLMIVFKDALLGFTAGIMISANDLVRNKDWIEIDGTHVDGEVVDVSLTTVKVRNWDKTIATVPAYTLISTPFKNWRGMKNSGGRRIKRAIYIDLQTIHFASEEEIRHWRQIELLKPYLEQKLLEIRAANSSVPAEIASESRANVRALTNIGTFRAYCVAYLRAHKKIHQKMTMIVRQLDPCVTGLPLEIYVFTNDTQWEAYEGIQSDIFDHLFAIIPEFGLRPFQEPSGENFSALAAAGTTKSSEK